MSPKSTFFLHALKAEYKLLPESTRKNLRRASVKNPFDVAHAAADGKATGHEHPTDEGFHRENEHDDEVVWW
jgi:hypothetical protein